MEKCALEKLEIMAREYGENVFDAIMQKGSEQQKLAFQKLAEDAKAESFMLDFGDLVSDMVLTKIAAAQQMAQNGRVEGEKTAAQNNLNSLLGL